MGIANAILAGVGGAAKGVESQQRFDKAEELKRQLAAQQEELRVMLAKISDSTKQRGQDLTDAQKAADRTARDADRKQRADTAAANLERLWSHDTDTSALNWDKNRLTEQGQSDTNDRFWGGTMPLGYDRIAATERGQDMSASTARRGQDIGASTARRGQDMTSSTAAAAQTGATDRSRARNVLDVLRLKQRGDASLLGGDDNTDFAGEFDRLYNDPNAMGGEAARALSSAPAPAPAGAAPAPSAPLPVAPTRAPVPVPARPQAAAPTEDPRLAVATQLVALTKQVTTMPPGPAREDAKKKLAALRAQAETLRTPNPGQD